MVTKTRRLLLCIGIPVGSVLVILLTLSLLYLNKMRAEINSFTPLDSQEVVEGVYLIKGNSYMNFYVVEGSNNIIAFDCGENKNTVTKELAKFNLNLSRVEAVFLTHTDSDHAGALGLFSNAKVYIADEEEQMINGKKAKTLIFKNKISTTYNTLHDKQDIEFAGLKVHCILTPGHTPGSMSYVVNDMYLFTGDTLSLKNGKVELFNDFFNMDTNQQKDSITDLAKLSGIKYIFTTHYGYSSNYQEAFAKWISN